MGSQHWAIMVSGYNRPHHLRSCGESIKQALEQFPHAVEIYLNLDLAEDPQTTRLCQEAFRSALEPTPVQYILQSVRRFTWSIAWGWHELLSASSSLTHLVSIEDDVVLAPNALRFFWNSMQWAEKHDIQPAFLSAWSICRLPAEEKQRQANRMRSGTENHFCSVWQVSRIRQVWPFVEEGYRRFSHYNAFSLPCIRELRQYRWQLLEGRSPLRTRIPGRAYLSHLLDLYQSGMAASCDSIVHSALLHLGYVPVIPVVNRCLNVGREGFHCRPEIYDSWNWDTITLDPLEEPEEYDWIDGN